MRLRVSTDSYGRATARADLKDKKFATLSPSQAEVSSISLAGLLKLNVPGPKDADTAFNCIQDTTDSVPWAAPW